MAHASVIDDVQQEASGVERWAPFAHDRNGARLAAILGFAGAGAASLDATLGLTHPSVRSGFLVVALGLAAGFGVLFSRAAA